MQQDSNPQPLSSNHLTFNHLDTLLTHHTLWILFENFIKNLKLKLLLTSEVKHNKINLLTSNNSDSDVNFVFLALLDLETKFWKNTI